MNHLKGLTQNKKKNYAQFVFHLSMDVDGPFV
jgi:hypothetical protein